MIYELIEKGLVPDFLIRMGIKYLCRKRLDQEYEGDIKLTQKKRVQELSQGEIAINTLMPISSIMKSPLTSIILY